jgi:Ca-activated chloride channel family protein
MLVLESAAALLLLVPVPVFVWYVFFRKRRGGLVTFGYSVWKGKRFAVPLSRTGFLFAVSNIASVVGLCTLVIALARPEFVEKEKVYLTRGIDMMIVLDESPSMSAPDFRPVNRFETARDVIRRFVRSRENDRIGLVTFGSEAALRVPPTLDYDFFEETLGSLTIMELGEGTAIGMGIAVAALHLSSGTTKEKVIILVTDGVNNEGTITPLDAAASAARLGMRIYTIGIGSETELEWTFTDPATGTPYAARAGQFDELLLRSIASMSGARYFNAGESRMLAAVFAEIDTIETTGKRIKIVAHRTPIHVPLILSGLALLGLSYVLRKTICGEVV